jgi:hypothetical protein
VGELILDYIEVTSRFVSTFTMKWSDVMACSCVNDEGCPALECDGTCINERMINPDKQERAMEDSFTDKQMRQLQGILNTMEIHYLWIRGFVAGFNEGFKNGKEG